MIKVEVTEEFTYKEFDKIKDTLVRHSRAKEGWLYVGDTFECDEATLKYLTGENKLHKTVVKVIEIIPEAKIQEAIKEAVEKEQVRVGEETKPTKKTKKTKKNK